MSRVPALCPVALLVALTAPARVTAQPVADHAASSAAPRTSCAVVPLGPGAEGGPAAVVHGLVRAETTSLGTCLLLAEKVTTAELSTARSMGLNCSVDDVNCLRKIAVLLRVDQLIVSTVSESSADQLLKLKLIEELAGVQVREVEVAINPLEAPIRAQVATAVTRLLLPDRMTGTLVVNVTPADARVSVDGRELASGQATAPITGLLQGAHRIEVEAEGYAGQRREIEIRAGEKVAIDINLDTAATPSAAQDGSTAGVLRTAGWVALGLGGGIAALGGLSALAIDRTLALSGTGTHEERSAWLSTERSLAIAAGVGALVGAAGAGLLFFGPGE